MTERPVKFTFPVRVYFEDTDAGGVVYYANYLKYLERCRSEWLRSVGFDQSALLRDPGIAFVVRSVNVEYLKPARLDDELLIELTVGKIGRAQIHFQQRIRRARPAGEDEKAGELLVGAIQIVCVNSALMKITSLPPLLRSKLEALQ